MLLTRSSLVLQILFPCTLGTARFCSLTVFSVPDGFTFIITSYCSSDHLLILVLCGDIVYTSLAQVGQTFCWQVIVTGRSDLKSRKPNSPPIVMPVLSLFLGRERIVVILPRKKVPTFAQAVKVLFPSERLQDNRLTVLTIVVFTISERYLSAVL